jgi:hypothetical protein
VNCVRTRCFLGHTLPPGRTELLSARFDGYPVFGHNSNISPQMIMVTFELLMRFTSLFSASDRSREGRSRQFDHKGSAQRSVFCPRPKLPCRKKVRTNGIVSDNRPVETHCQRCNFPISCHPEGHCWCAELPLGPMPAEATGCLCPDCLKKSLDVIGSFVNQSGRQDSRTGILDQIRK